MFRYLLSILFLVAACARGTTRARDDAPLSPTATTDTRIPGPAGNLDGGPAPAASGTPHAESNCEEEAVPLEASALHGPYSSLASFCKDQNLAKCRQDRALSVPAGMAVGQASLVRAIQYGEWAHFLGLVRHGQWYFSDSLRAPDESIQRADLADSHLQVLPIEIRLSLQRREEAAGQETIVFRRSDSILCGVTREDSLACVTVPTNHVAERKNGESASPNAEVRISQCPDGSLVLSGDTTGLHHETASSVRQILGHRRVTLPL